VKSAARVLPMLLPPVFKEFGKRDTVELAGGEKSTFSDIRLALGKELLRKPQAALSGAFADDATLLILVSDIGDTVSKINTTPHGLLDGVSMCATRRPHGSLFEPLYQL